MSTKPRHPPYKKGAEARENGRKGGLKAGKIRRLKRSLREWAEIFRDVPTKTDPHLTMGGAVALRMYDQAISGDVRAAQFLAELQGEMEEKISVKAIPRMIDDI